MSIEEIAIALPFSIDPYGKVAVTTSQSKIWQDRVLSVIGTAVRERVMRPNFGTIIPYSVFNNSEDAVSEVEIEIRKAFSVQLPLLTVETVKVSEDSYTHALSVDVVYDLPNNIKETVNSTIGLISIASTNPAYEESL